MNAKPKTALEMQLGLTGPGAEFVERYEMALKQLAKVLEADPLMAFQLFDTMKTAMAADFNQCVRQAVALEVEYIRDRLEAEYRELLEGHSRM